MLKCWVYLKGVNIFVANIVYIDKKKLLVFDKQIIYGKNVCEETVQKLDIELHNEARMENVFLKLLEKNLPKSLFIFKI